jgi:hypothetical protein
MAYGLNGGGNSQTLNSDTRRVSHERLALQSGHDEMNWVKEVKWRQQANKEQEQFCIRIKNSFLYNNVTYV